jgi:predicted RNase H-like HicB family nuclease
MVTFNLETLQSYVQQPWSYSLDYWPDEGGYYVCRVLELPSCQTHGSTPEEAIHTVPEAIESYIASLLEDNLPVPLPLQVQQFKGVITYRTKPVKHHALAKVAQQLGLSINRVLETAVDNFLEQRA